MPVDRFTIEGQDRASIEARFWPKVRRRRSADACWPWKAGRHSSGWKGSRIVGVFRVGPRVFSAPRVALALATGRMPAHLDACHKCDHPLCCRPEHLFWGEKRENVKSWIAAQKKKKWAQRRASSRRSSS